MYWGIEWDEASGQRDYPGAFVAAMAEIGIASTVELIKRIAQDHPQNTTTKARS